MNRTHPLSTRRKATYKDVGNADIARSKKPAMRVMVADKCVRFMSLADNGVAVKMNNEKFKTGTVLNMT
jgi:hypothetical protein